MRVHVRQHIHVYTNQNIVIFHIIFPFQYSWAAIPFMYLLTRLCRYVATAYLLVFLVNFFVGLATTMVMFLLYQTSYEQVCI